MSSRRMITIGVAGLLGAAMVFAYLHTNSSMPLTEDWVKQTVGRLGPAGPVVLAAAAVRTHARLRCPSFLSTPLGHGIISGALRCDSRVAHLANG